jgi:acyl carrier protein
MSDLNPLLEEVLRPHLVLLDRDQPVAPETELRDMGVDSLSLIEVLVAVENTFGVEFPDEFLVAETFRTPGSLWAAICKLRS